MVLVARGLAPRGSTLTVQNPGAGTDKDTHVEFTVDRNQVAWSETIASTIIENLTKRRMEGSYASSSAQARDEVLAMIPQGAPPSTAVPR